jgi:hypothetical protein
MVTHGKRIAYGRNQNRVAIATYPDDTSVPVRTSHWNQNPHDQAVLGFTKITATLASDVLQTKDNSSTTLEDDGNTYSRQSTLIEVVPQSGSSTDVISKINIIDTLENDILYLFKATASDTITIADATPSVAGHIKTQLSGGATLVHDGVPIMLIRRGDYWYEFGADGAASSFTPTSTDTLTGKTIDANGTGNSITNIENADIAAGAAILTSKLSGAVTSIASHGLAASATTDTTSASNISTGTLAAARVATLNQNTTGTAASCTGNSANVTGVVANANLDADTAHLSTTQTFTGDKTFTPLTTHTGGIDVVGANIDNIQNLIHDITSTASVSGARTLDLNADQLETWALSGSTAITFATTSNKAAGRSKTIRLVNDGTLQNLTLHSSWKIVGAAPTDIAASKTGILTLTCFGTAETDIVAAYAVEA